MRTPLLALAACAVMGLSPVAEPPVEVMFDEPTGRYAHGVLGDAIEWGALRGVTARGEEAFVLSLPLDRVFEDIEVRRADLGHGDTVVVVEAQRDLGAQLAVYRVEDGSIRKIAATPHIGRRNRWLAPAAIADFDGDGTNDIAYVETPHLAGILKIVTLRDGALVPVAVPMPGFSNHRIGEDFITGDVRSCDGTVELVLPDLSWTTLMAVRIEEGRILSRPLPHAPDRDGVLAATRCED